MPFIMEPLSVLQQYALQTAINKLEKPNENWILNQLIPAKLLIKHQSMVDDWVGTIKNPQAEEIFYENIVMQG